ncbi:MAG: Lipid export ATP-binding/permease protein MsbA [Myxococcaceae bacterium]|nr:Lipid export ATP-binding/permease protein MsbA [Myxococcaceae bacterium]
MVAQTSLPTAVGPLVRLLGYVSRHRSSALVTVLFGVLGFALSFAYPWIVGSVIDVIAAPASAGLSVADRSARVIRLAELGVLVAIGHAIVVYGRGHSNVHLGHGVVSDIRRALLEHLQTLSVRFFTKERTGAIQSRILHDVHEATALIYTGILVAGMDALQLAIAVGLLVAISWKLTLACFFLFPFYGVVFAVMNPRVRRASERMNSAFSRMAGNVTEKLNGQALIKTYTAESREAKLFGEEVVAHHGLVVRQSHEGHVVAGCGEILVHLGTTIVIGYGGWLAVHGELTPGLVTRFLGYMLIMFGPVRRFAELNMTYQSSLSAMRRVFRVLDVPPSVVEPARPHRSAPARGHVRLEDVWYRYDDDSVEARTHLDGDGPEEAADSSERAGARSSPDPAWVLKGITLEARPGERVAIVGLSGAGKTTLVSLLPRLYDVSRGRVVIDGVDGRD